MKRKKIKGDVRDIIQTLRNIADRLEKEQEPGYFVKVPPPPPKPLRPTKKIPQIVPPGRGTRPGVYPPADFVPGPGAPPYRKGFGPGGSCVCPNCGFKSIHYAGQPCNVLPCPQCGTIMVRDPLPVVSKLLDVDVDLALDLYHNFLKRMRRRS